MDKKTFGNVLDPFFTTKKGKKVGLGLSLLSQAAEQAGGKLKISSKLRGCTKVIAYFKLNHPYIKPIGNIFETIKTLIVGSSSTHIIYSYNKKGTNFHFDSHK